MLDTLCGTTTNHTIQIVSYGHDAVSDLEYWLVRNNWSTLWGDQGYAKIAITEGEGVLGINTKPLYPIVA